MFHLTEELQKGLALTLTGARSRLEGSGRMNASAASSNCNTLKRTILCFSGYEC